MLSNADILVALDESEVTEQAKQRYAQTDSYQANLRSRYEKFHHWYRPLNGPRTRPFARG